MIGWIGLLVGAVIQNTNYGNKNWSKNIGKQYIFED
jgi:hypothetical protein